MQTLPEERKDDDFEGQIIFLLLFYVAFPGLIFLLVIFNFSSPLKLWQWVVGIGMPMSIAANFCYHYYQLWHHYKCPQCGNLLPAPKPKPTTNEYCYYCKKCHIVWRTSVYRGDDA